MEVHLNQPLTIPMTYESHGPAAIHMYTATRKTINKEAHEQIDLLLLLQALHLAIHIPTLKQKHTQIHIHPQSKSNPTGISTLSFPQQENTIRVLGNHEPFHYLLLYPAPTRFSS